MAHLSHVRGDSFVIDPAAARDALIESALYALRIAPGLRRRFAAEKWDALDKTVWQRERERAQDLIRTDRSFSALGCDIDAAALELTLENARKAGAAAHPRRSVGWTASAPTPNGGTVICNPPYGERLLDLRQAEELYKTMGKVFEQKAGWSYTVISPDDTFEACFGRKADKRRKLYNGMIKCQLYFTLKRDLSVAFFDPSILSGGLPMRYVFIFNPVAGKKESV